MSKKKKIVEKGIITNDLGEEIHVFDGPEGEVHIKSINPMAKLYSGEQWCPQCHIQMELKRSKYTCPDCGMVISKEEADDGYGYPTLESSYEDDYGEYYSEELESWEDL